MIDQFVVSALSDIPHEQITALVIHPAAIGFDLSLQTVGMGLVKLGCFKSLEFVKQLANDLHEGQGWEIVPDTKSG